MLKLVGTKVPYVAMYLHRCLIINDLDQLITRRKIQNFDELLQLSTQPCNVTYVCHKLFPPVKCCTVLVSNTSFIVISYYDFMTTIWHYTYVAIHLSFMIAVQFMIQYIYLASLHMYFELGNRLMGVFSEELSCWSTDPTEFILTVVLALLRIRTCSNGLWLGGITSITVHRNRIQYNAITSWKLV